MSNKRRNRLNHRSPNPRSFFKKKNDYSHHPTDFVEGEVIADQFQKDENNTNVDKLKVIEESVLISSDSPHISLIQSIKDPPEECFFSKNNRTLFVKPLIDKYSAGIHISVRQPSNSEMNIEDVEETDFVEEFIS